MIICSPSVITYNVIDQAMNHSPTRRSTSHARRLTSGSRRWRGQSRSSSRHPSLHTATGSSRCPSQWRHTCLWRPSNDVIQQTSSMLSERRNGVCAFQRWASHQTAFQRPMQEEKWPADNHSWDTRWVFNLAPCQELWAPSPRRELRIVLDYPCRPPFRNKASNLDIKCSRHSVFSRTCLIIFLIFSSLSLERIVSDCLSKSFSRNKPHFLFQAEQFNVGCSYEHANGQAVMRCLL
jgi:hypothetical protein